MPKFAANLTMLFNEVEFLDRFAAAAKAGFKGVEYLFPYAFPKEALAERLAQHGLTQVLHNLPAGDWAKGERGIACLPGPGGGIPRRRRDRHRLCQGAGLRAGQLPRRHRAEGRGRGARARDARRQSALRRRRSPTRASGCWSSRSTATTFPASISTRSRSDVGVVRRGRRGQSLAAIRHLSHAAHGGRTRGDDAGAAAAHRPHPDRRQSRPQRAGNRRDQLRLSVPPARRARLRRLGRLRIQAQDHDRGGLGWLARAGAR